MATTIKTWGFSRRAEAAKHGTPKHCPKCTSWFAAAPRQRVCEGCRPRWKNSLKTATPGNDTGTALNGGVLAGQRVVKRGVVYLYSPFLCLWFQARETDQRAARLETIVLAHEEAARQVWGKTYEPVPYHIKPPWEKR